MHTCPREGTASRTYAYVSVGPLLPVRCVCHVLLSLLPACLSHNFLSLLLFSTRFPGPSVMSLCSYVSSASHF